VDGRDKPGHDGKGEKAVPAGIWVHLLRCIGLILLLWSASAAADTVLRRGITAEPGTLDPHSGDSIHQLRLVADLFEGLTAIAPGGRIVPGQAESWSVSPDGLIWTFTLRPGLAWSNGAPLTAADFVDSFRRLVDPANALRLSFLAEPILHAGALIARRETDLTQLGVEAPDPHTLRITLEAPEPALPEILAQLAPVYRPALDSTGRDAFKPGHIVSNGAYRLVEWQKGTRLVAERNPAYRDAASVRIDRIEYYPIEAVAEEFKRYRAGEIDLTSDVPNDELDLILRDFPDQLKSSPSFGLYYIGFNSRQPPFKDNAKLREALTLAIDRSALTDKLLRDGAIPAYGWIPPGIPGYRGAVFPGAELSQAAREAAARRAYEEAGYSAEHPLDLALAYNTSDVNRRQMIAIAAMWRQVLGVRTELRNMELRSLLDLRQQGVHSQAFRAGFVAPYVDPLPLLQLLRSGASYNDLGYANPGFDAALAKAEALPDRQARLDGLAAAEAIGLADFPAAPVYYLAQQRLIKPYVTGWRPSPRDTFRSQDLAITPH
jgi:oligopeptide transport system substrate-binding protein